MTYSKFIFIHSIILITILGFIQESFSWSLFVLLKDQKLNNEEIKGIMDYDLNKDIAFLPPLENKSFIEAIDDLSICRKRDVRKYIYLYLTSGRKFLINGIKRSKVYYRIIEKIFEKNRDIPLYISLLPLLESGFSPYAVSRSKAVGIWQFMKPTARALGLKTDRWLDERRDIEKSTIAAIRHLKSLYKTFQSWELALTAYNGGAGHVKRAMLKSKAINFLELYRSGMLKKQTEEFVPRFIALLVIFKNQKLFDIGAEIDDFTAIETKNFVINYPINIHYISKLAGVSIKTIRKYNPELKRNITPPYYKKYTLRLPVYACKKLKEKRRSLYKYRYKKIRRHIVKKGECISKIAVRYKIRPKMIIRFNKIKNPRLIRPGQRLYIPI